jgi:hypothetical protein
VSASFSTPKYRIEQQLHDRSNFEGHFRNNGGTCTARTYEIIEGRAKMRGIFIQGKLKVCKRVKYAKEKRVCAE